MTISRIDKAVQSAGRGARIGRVFTCFPVWAANILLIGGAILISALPSSASAPAIFGAFLIGHLFLSAHSLRIQDRGLLTLNMSMAALDLYAIAIRL